MLDISTDPVIREAIDRAHAERARVITAFLKSLFTFKSRQADTTKVAQPA